MSRREHGQMIGEARPMSAEILGQPRYLVRGRVLSVFGGFRVYDAGGELVLWGRLRRGREGDGISLFRDEERPVEVISVRARERSHIWDVVDGATGQRIGALKRKEWVPFARDHWTLFDPEDREIGVIREESVWLASLNRYSPYLVPRRFRGEAGGRPVCSLSQRFSPFAMKLELDFSEDPAGLLDRRLGIAVAVLICALGPKG